MLRIIKGHGPHTRFEYQSLVQLENAVAKFLQMRYPQICRLTLRPDIGQFDVYEFLKAEFDGDEAN